MLLNINQLHLRNFNVVQEIMVLGVAHINLKVIFFNGKIKKIIKVLSSLQNKKKLSLNKKSTFKDIIGRNERRKA